MTVLRGRRRLGWKAAAGALGVCWTVAFGVGPVAADEFPAMVVVPTSGAVTAQGRDALAGFRVAVDASPDVSHPSGIEGGDHLGGSDVEVAVIDAGGGPTASAAAVRAQSSGAGIVVVLAPPPGVLEAVLEAMGDADVLIIVAGADSATTAGNDARVVVLRNRGEDAGSAATFEAAFRAAQGRPATDVAAAGYDAGVAIDLAVDAFGPEVNDPARVARLLADTGRFARSVVAAPASGTTVPAARPASPPPSVEGQRPASRGILLGAGATIAAAAGAAMVLARRAARRREST